MEGVREQLDAGLLRHNEEFGGVMLAYTRVQLVDKQAALHPYFPYLKVEVKARVVVFDPHVGQHLVGRVNKLGQDFVSLLVLGVFQCSIGREAMRRELQKLLSGKESGQHFALGSQVQFRVDSIRDDGGIFVMAGSLNEPGTGLAAGSKGADAPRSKAAAAAGPAAANGTGKRKRIDSANDT